MNEILQAVLVVLVPFAAAFAVVYALKLNDFIAALPEPLPALAKVAVAFLFGLLSKLIGFTLPADLAQFDQATVTAALMFVVQLLFPLPAGIKAARAKMRKF